MMEAKDMVISRGENNASDVDELENGIMIHTKAGVEQEAHLMRT
jgi:hypothetical protein